MVHFERYLILIGLVFASFNHKDFFLQREPTLPDFLSRNSCNLISVFFYQTLECLNVLRLSLFESGGTQVTRSNFDSFMDPILEGEHG